MANESTVTITIDEYFELRQKASMNDFLMVELGRLNECLTQHDRRLFELEDRVREIKNGK